MITPLASTITPDPCPRSFRSFGNSSPKNRRKNGSSNGEPRNPSPLRPLRVAEIFTTVGLTSLAISTKFRPLPLVIGDCGAVATGRTSTLGLGSGPAVPEGSQPRSDATITPIPIPIPTSSTGTTHDRRDVTGGCCQSFMPYHTSESRIRHSRLSLYLTGVNAHDGLQEFDRLGLRALERISPNDGTESPACANGAGLLEHVLIFALGTTGEDHNPPPVERALDHMFHPLGEGLDRNLRHFINFFRCSLFKMCRGQFHLDDMGSQLSGNLRGIGDHVHRRFPFLAERRAAGIRPHHNGQTAGFCLFGNGAQLFVHRIAMS